MAPDDTLVDAASLSGKFAYFREPPGIHSVVRVLSVTTVRSGWHRIRLECVAGIRAPRPFESQPGERFSVEGPARELRNIVWSLHPLQADDLESALAEVQREHGRGRMTFIRPADAPSSET